MIDKSVDSVDLKRAVLTQQAIKEVEKTVYALGVPVGQAVWFVSPEQAMNLAEAHGNFKREVLKDGKEELRYVKDDPFFCKKFCGFNVERSWYLNEGTFKLMSKDLDVLLTVKNARTVEL